MRKILSLLFLVSAFAGTAYALPANDVTTSYFSDAAKTKLVGTVERTCAGGTIVFGRKTAFSTRTSDSCLPHRISRSAVLSSARRGLSPQQTCHAMCERRFGGPGICLPDGSCPKQEAAAECNATCDAQFNATSNGQ